MTPRDHPAPGGTASPEYLAPGDATLHRPELRFLQTVHGRLSSGRPVARVRLGPLDETQREALADLLGLDRLPDPRPSVALARLEEAVTELSGRTVREVVAELVGGRRAGGGFRCRGPPEAPLRLSVTPVRRSERPKGRGLRARRSPSVEGASRCSPGPSY